MRRHKFIISYDGTNYAGWQRQPNGTSIQEMVEGALAQIVGDKIRIFGSGRTDRGVHARGQVAHADLSTSVVRAELTHSLNAVLPEDIRIVRISRTVADFDARKSAREKEYRYLIWDDPVLPPFIRTYRAHRRKALDVDAMQKAARHLEGRHDFAAFTANSNRPIGSTTRMLHELSIRRRGHEVIIIARGEGFLYKMVRSLAGFLIRVGEGRVSPSEARTLLAGGKRTARVPTAPPQGLFLWSVRY
ncbi:MAG: tRNA pseudouridine(38-40) synthase TruA [Verrucomicrobia bacterium]|nr:tRNA pseudouridine(38-40) synthase TruA [Verrucomicrobiota bacterium]MDA1086250.1 tRNA pseudouridine(38-40) synthase TruA [Verrucomicrobiota bacterium]